MSTGKSRGSTSEQRGQKARKGTCETLGPSLFGGCSELTTACKASLTWMHAECMHMAGGHHV